MLKRFSRFDWGFLAACVLPVIGFLPILRQRIIDTADGTVHIYRMFAVQQLVQQGNFWPRWIPYFHLGYGYPLFNFYPLGVYHLAVFLGLFGISMPFAYNIIAALAWVIGSVGMYSFGRALLPGHAALLATVLWAFAPMRMYEVWHQGSLPTIMATAFVPWVFWGLLQVVRNPNPRTMLSLTWPFVAMVMSHPPVTFMTGLFLAPAAGIFILAGGRTHSLRRAVFIAGGLLLAVGITAIFLIPLFAELKYIASSGTASDVIPYLRSQFLQPGEVFTLFPPTDITDLRFELPTSLGLIGGVLSLFGLVALVKEKRYGAAAVLALALAFFIFMLFEVSFDVWLAIPLLAQLRSSMRFLSVGSLFIALAGGAALLLLPKRWWTLALTILLPVSILVVMPLTFTNQNTVSWENGITTKDEIEHELSAFVWGSTSYDEFDPIWGERIPLDPPADLDAYITDPMRIVVKELDIIRQLPDLKVEQLDTATVKIAVTSARPVRFRHYYFPGWTATMNGIPAEIYPEDEYGLLTIDVPEGEHIIALEYKGTAIQAISTLISAASLCFVGALLFLTRKKTLAQAPLNDTASSQRLDKRWAAAIAASAFAFAVVNQVFITPHTLLFRQRSDANAPVYMQSAVNQRFGDTFELLGYTLEQSSAAPGGILNVLLFWQPLKDITEEYRPVVQLVNLPVTAAWASNEPVLLGNNKTIGYTADRFASDVHKLRLFDTAPPYVGRISVQLKDTTSGEFLILPDGSDRVILEPLIRINGNGQPAQHLLDYTLGDSVELWCASVTQSANQYTIELYWHMKQPLEKDLTALVHGLDEAGELVTQGDNPPISDYPSSFWLPGQHLNSVLILPYDEKVTSVAVGLYDSDGNRLKIIQKDQPVPEDRILLPLMPTQCQS